MARWGKPSRRSFLVMAGVSGAVALSAPRLSAILDPLGKGVAEESARAAHRIGRLYLARHPEEAHAGVLERSLFGTVGSRLDHQRTAEAWHAACRADFLAERLVSIEGWWLARSEARLCALLHLSAAGRPA